MGTTTPSISTRTNGQTIDETWFNVLKSVAEDHEDRVDALETLVREIRFDINGFIGDSSVVGAVPVNGVLYYPLLEDVHFTSGQIFVVAAGTSGTYQADIKFKRGAGSYTSIFTTKPSSVYTDGDLYTSTNGVLDGANDDLLAGDVLRLDLTGSQLGGRGLSLRLKYTRSI